MKRKWMKIGVVTLAASSLILQNGYWPAAQVSAAASQATISNKYVKLNATSYLNIRDAHFLMQDKGKVLAFSVAITNNGSNELDLLDYWLRVKTKSGKSFKSTVIEADKDKTTVAAKTTQYITYYTVVDAQTKLNDISFEVVKWDFSVDNYERRLGVIQYPANSTEQVTAFQGAVMLYNNNKIKGAVKQAFITKDANSAYLTVNFLLENVGLQAADLSKMNFFVQTQSMSVYTVSSGLDQQVIQPKERKIVTLHATIPLAVAGKPLSFVVAQNDEASKVQLPTGVFALPTMKSAAASAVGQARMVYMDGIPVKTISGQVFVTQGSDSNQVALDFTITNTGTASIASPALDYFIVTPAGTNYPLTYTKEENAVLLPNIEKTVSLTGSIPTNVSLDNAQLVVKTTATDKVKSYIIGNYKIQSTTQQGSFGSSFTYNDYNIKLNSVERTPMDDNDMLVANLTVTNNSQMTKQIPALGGYFMVNGVKVGTEQKAVALDDSITMTPGGSADFAVYTEIPYTTAIDKITFVSTEPVQDKAGKQLYQFSGRKLSDIPILASDRAYEITNIGKRSSVKLIRSAVFTGDAKNTFYAEFEAVNNETRSSVLAKLGGYIQDQNGVVVPVTFTEVKDKISPSGKALMAASASISKNFDSSAFRFILGQAIGGTSDGGSGGSNGSTTGSDGGSGTGGNAQSTVIVTPASYTMSSLNPATQTELTGINFAGYTLDLRHINSYLNVAGEFNVTGLKMVLDYTLAKDPQYESIAGDHKLMIEFVNQDTNQVTYSKQYTLSAAGENEEQLKEAVNNPLTIVFNDSDIQSKIQQYETYKVNVYDVFQDTKLLLASKELHWFTVSP